MNIRRILINSILGILSFNAAASLTAFIRHTPFQFNVILGLVTPIVASLVSALMQTPKERANHL